MCLSALPSYMYKQQEVLITQYTCKCTEQRELGGRVQFFSHFSIALRIPSKNKTEAKYFSTLQGFTKVSSGEKQGRKMSVTNPHVLTDKIQYTCVPMQITRWVKFHHLRCKNQLCIESHFKT